MPLYNFQTPAYPESSDAFVRLQHLENILTPVCGFVNLHGSYDSDNSGLAVWSIVGSIDDLGSDFITEVFNAANIKVTINEIEICTETE